MKNYIIYNGLHSIEDMNVLIDTLSIPSINEVIENIDVEGRNGSLTIRHGNYLDRIIPFKITLIREINEPIESFIDRADMVLNWLELEDNNELITYLRPNKKYIVKAINKGEIEIENSRLINIEGEFICEPFIYELTEASVVLTQASNLYYQGFMPGECNIKIYGSGNIQLTINGDTVQINNINQYVELDSKFLLCLNKDKTSKTKDMIGNFPLLTRGKNEISWTGNISKIEILPRTAYK